MTEKNPDIILKRIKATEKEENNRGELKIFLGFCAGVGKTFEMLEETQNAIKNKIDTVIGIVETHGRKETEKLLEGIESIPKKKIEYNGLSLEEMDLDAILERKPKLAIVDELAHTNVPGSRHEKRYQDVEELLTAGIDVYTTLNIQHIESLIDIVQQISHIKVKETVPDSIIEMASEIKLVDLTPDKLLERLQEGKVYVPEKATLAMQKFFRKGNLLALRELSLRYTAKHVDTQMLSYKQKFAIQTPWPVDSKILVGFSASPTSERLLRITHRMAADFDSQWFAVYIESPQQVTIGENAKHQLDKNILLAEELGAKVVNLYGNSIADELINFAQEKNINLIVVGPSHRSLFEELQKGSVLNTLIKNCANLNIFIAGSNSENEKRTTSLHTEKDKAGITHYLLSFLSVILIVLFGKYCQEWFSPLNTFMLLLLPVLNSSIIWGTRAGLFTSISAIFCFDFFLVPPYFEILPRDLTYLPGITVFVIISVIISVMSKAIRWKTDRARHNAKFLESLYYFSREIMASKNREESIKKSEQYITEAFDCEVSILLPGKNSTLINEVKNGVPILNEKEMAVAMWVFKNGAPAGRNTHTLFSGKWKYLPLKTEGRTFGVLAVLPKPEAEPSLDQRKLLESFANIIAVCIKSSV